MAQVAYDNRKIEEWADKNFTDVKQAIDGLGIKHAPKSPNPRALKNNLTKKVQYRDGFITRVSYGMPKSGIYVHKGVGRGHGIDNPREAKRWFDIPTEINLPELQQIVAENDATFIINNLTIK